MPEQQDFADLFFSDGPPRRKRSGSHSSGVSHTRRPFEQFVQPTVTPLQLESNGILIRGLPIELVEVTAKELGVECFSVPDPDNKGCYLLAKPGAHSELALDGDERSCPLCSGKIVFVQRLIDWVCPTCGYSDHFRRRLALKEHDMYMSKEAPLATTENELVDLPLYYLESLDWTILKPERILIYQGAPWYRVPGTKAILVSTSLFDDLKEASDLSEFGIDLFEKWIVECIPYELHGHSKYDGFFVRGEETPAEEQDGASTGDETEERVPHQIVNTGKGGQDTVAYLLSVIGEDDDDGKSEGKSTDDRSDGDSQQPGPNG